MVIHKTIAHLRSRPSHERRSFAALFSISIAGIIFLAWVILFINKIQTGSTANGEEEPQVATAGVAILEDY